LPGIANGTALDTKGPIAVDAIAPDADWQAVWRDTDAERRDGCSWVNSAAGA